jgi:hypothetical protein
MTWRTRSIVPLRWHVKFYSSVLTYCTSRKWVCLLPKIVKCWIPQIWVELPLIHQFFAIYLFFSLGMVVWARYSVTRLTQHVLPSYNWKKCHFLLSVDWLVPRRSWYKFYALTFNT